MNDKITARRVWRHLADRGFTLIELLVVVVIIGILVAIAIPLYSNYTKGAANKATQSDVRNAVAVVEQCYSTNGSYPTSVAGAASTDLSFSAHGCTGGVAHVSNGVTLSYSIGANNVYQITGCNSNGDSCYVYSSDTGKPSASPTP